MTAPKIAVFANHASPQAAAVRDALVESGAEPLTFDIQLGGPRTPALTMGGGKARWDGVDFDGIRAIHIRCTAPNTLPALPPVLNAASHAETRARYLREQEHQASVMSFFSYLADQGKLVINPLTEGYVNHDSKGQFYERLRADGMTVPDVLTTSDPVRAAAFLDRHVEAVVKPAIGVGSTRVVTAADRDRLEEIAVCPVLMQQRIQGRTLRVHVVGDTVVLALRIISEGGVDSRTDTKSFEYLRLPEAAAAQIIRANRMFGLHYAAWDVQEGEDGGHYLLDCNPGPFIMWIGPHYVREVFRRLAAYMTTFARTGSLVEAAAAVEPVAEKGAG